MAQDFLAEAGTPSTWPIFFLFSSTFWEKNSESTTVPEFYGICCHDLHYWTCFHNVSLLFRNRPLGYHVYFCYFKCKEFLIHIICDETVGYEEGNKQNEVHSYRNFIISTKEPGLHARILLKKFVWIAWRMQMNKWIDVKLIKYIPSEVTLQNYKFLPKCKNPYSTERPSSQNWTSVTRLGER